MLTILHSKTSLLKQLVQIKAEKNIWFITFILSAIAGYCDATTFVAADHLFSAHVTGNFIVFAYELVKGTDSGVWLKLGTFPVFVISVIIGGWVVSRSANKNMLLMVEGMVLLISGTVANYLKLYDTVNEGWSVLLVMMIVFAMGLQNTFGKLFSKETLGPTTVMTGNVAQASLDIYNMINSKFSEPAILLNLKKQSILICGFFIGSLCGALLSNFIGLGAIVLPGIVLLFLCVNKSTLLKSNILKVRNTDILPDKT
jgi:uncharacterized membrane protein YoaK (UPF0700 family)